jgi:hypothetical protein
LCFLYSVLCILYDVVRGGTNKRLAVCVLLRFVYDTNPPQKSPHAATDLRLPVYELVYTVYLYCWADSIYFLYILITLRSFFFLCVFLLCCACCCSSEAPIGPSNTLGFDCMPVGPLHPSTDLGVFHLLFSSLYKDRSSNII